MNDIIDKVYCVNLLDSVDRRQAMEHEFEKHSLMATFVDAVKVADKESQEVWTKKTDHRTVARCYCIDRCSHRKRRLRPVEVSISLSHRKVYQQMIADDCRLTLVCEDDIVFHDDLDEIVATAFTSEILESLTQAPFIVFLGGRADNPGLMLSNQRLVSSKTGSYSNYCYLINRSAAELLVKHFFPVIRPEDSYKRHLINSSLIKCYQMVPSLVAELSAGINAKKVYERLSR